ncbi:type III PLP-dependent enzyme [Streptomyces roseoverticillatus]|uniref:type III PLP-dependent enzyme n=1 Tax=Streptomyces roseoverticillatus TaxID=66429 RepID=UPI001F2A4F47|nr:type III PLP-dependent enzyme [Streptomyces roseoverticillatus]MCF3100669.1 type III PLP-dependent enzyme [Streptomyces roseoverticillatus]
MIPPRVARHATALPGGDLPAYVHDLTALAAHAEEIRAALPPETELYYAAKANPAPELLQALAPYVSGYEVSSGGELAHVRKAVPGLPLAFGGPGKTEPELRLALGLGTERIHVESESELRLLAALAEERPGEAPVDILLRVNLPADEGELGGAALAMGGRPSPFGLDPRRAEACLPLLRGTRLRLRGIHAHLASGLDAPALLAVAARITTWARALGERHGLGLDEVNVGGGMAVDYARPHARFDWAAYGAGLALLAAEHPAYRLRIEPGRALTAHSGWYVTEVLDVKHSHGEAFAVVRGGTHHLRTPAAKGHDQPFTVLSADTWERPWPRPAALDEPVTISGQLCTPKDVLARAVPVAELRAGDRIAFAMAGAYAWNISHHDFLMHPAPTFHFLS